MERHELGGRRLGDQLGWFNRNVLKQAEAESPHRMGSLEVALKASTAPLGPWLPRLVTLPYINVNVGPHVWSSHSH